MKYNIILNKNGLSEISFSLIPSPNTKNILRLIIRQLHSILGKIVGNNDSKIFIIARYRYADGTTRSIHKGIIINVDETFSKKYYSFINGIMDLKSNHYSIVKSEIPITEVFFNFFIVPKDSYEKYSKWEI